MINDEHLYHFDEVSARHGRYSGAPEMKRIFGTILVLGMLLLQQGWAKPVDLTQLEVLPVHMNRVLVRVESPTPITVEVTHHQGHPAIWLSDAQVPKTWMLPGNTIKPDRFLYPVPYALQVENTDKGSWLIFTTAALEISVVTSAQAMLEESARILPVYPSWPHVATEPARDITHELTVAQTQIDRHETQQALNKLETVYSQLPNPPKSLYQILGALYEEQRLRVKALCLYGQGAHRYPDALGLPYAALLYELKQPEKALQVLSDLLITAEISPATLAQARFILGSIYVERHDYAAALPFLEQAAEAFPNDAAVRYNLAVTYEGLHQSDRAIDQYELALKWADSSLKQNILQQLQRLKVQAAVGSS